MRKGFALQVVDYNGIQICIVERMTNKIICCFIFKIACSPTGERNIRLIHLFQDKLVCINFPG